MMGTKMIGYSDKEGNNNNIIIIEGKNTYK